MKCNACGVIFDEVYAAGICPNCGTPYERAAPETGGPTYGVWGQPVAAEAHPPVEPKRDTSWDHAHKDPRWLPAGTILHHRYRIMSVLGAGGFGITYLVTDLQTESVKAVKEYFQQGVVNRAVGHPEVVITAPKRQEEFEYGRARFLEEARIVAQFQSPSIVRVDDFFSENNTTYMVMEYLNAPTLEEYIIRRKRLLSPDEAIAIGVSLCDALEEIHHAGVIHRDIAPDNIFIMPDGSVKIIDFGSSRLSREDTEDRLIVLKPGYAPPEQYEQINLKRDTQKAWTDVYALGATLYMMLTGKVPVESTNRKADNDRNADSLCDPMTINHSIPEFLNNTIMTAMAINIHERFQNASEMKKALLQERKVLPVKEARKRKRIRRTAGIGAGFLAAAILLGIGVGKYTHDKNRVELPPASITVWYAVSEDEQLAAQKTEVLEDVWSELKQGDAFPKVDVTLRAIPEDEYEQTLAEAAENGEMPDLFESPSDDNPAMEHTEDLEPVLEMIDGNDCILLDEYAACFEEQNRLPVGFCAPVIYINTNLVQDYSPGTPIGSMADFMKLCDGDMKYKPLALNPLDEALYRSMLSDFSDASASFDSSLEDFLEGRAVAYFSDTSDYYRIRSALPEYFAMAPVDAEPVVCRFTDCWSISSEGSDDEILAAQTLLSYFLSNNFQDRYYLQTNLPGLPLQTAALESYYQEVHLGFPDILSGYAGFTPAPWKKG